MIISMIDVVELSITSIDRQLVLLWSLDFASRRTSSWRRARKTSSRGAAAAPTDEVGTPDP